MGAPLTESAIRKLREMIISGKYPSGAKLPPEPQLAAELGLSRNTVREAVRALSTARVLDVRRGDGTYVTSLRPELLLEGIAFAVDLMQAELSLELLQVRRILEPAVTALAAANIDEDALEHLEKTLIRMQESASNHAELVHYDADFHAQVAAAAGNDTLASMLNGISSRTLRARVWRGIIEEEAIALTISEHARILEALRAGDAALAEAAALTHVCTTEASLRRILAESVEAPSKGHPPAKNHAGAKTHATAKRKP
ncbi:MAG TPA: FCD domain-containing protein [Acidothermaceae bacterium]|nr:FCD domain-containing protein [Acidothermaceae bacterium]